MNYILYHIYYIVFNIYIICFILYYIYIIYIYILYHIYYLKHKMQCCTCFIQLDTTISALGNTTYDFVFIIGNRILINLNIKELSE